MSTILAIDLGKCNSILCWYEVESRQEVYRSITTTPDSLRAELQRQPITTVVIEACSQAGWVSDLCLSPCCRVHGLSYQPSHGCDVLCPERTHG